MAPVYIQNCDIKSSSETIFSGDCFNNTNRGLTGTYLLGDFMSLSYNNTFI